MDAWPTHWLQSNWSTPPSIPQLLRHAFLVGDGGELPFDNVLWSLAHELRISIFIPILVALPLLRGPRGWIALGLLGFLAPALAGAVHHAAFQWLLGAGLLQTGVISLYFSGAFMVGGAYAFADAGSRFQGSRSVAVAAALLAVGLLCVTYDPSSVLVAVLVLWLAEQQGVFARVLRLPVLQIAGRFSFSLYLAHVPVLLAVTQALGVGWDAVAAFVVLTVPATMLLFYAAERPAHRLARMVAPHGISLPFPRQPDPHPGRTRTDT